MKRHHVENPVLLPLRGFNEIETRRSFKPVLSP